MIKRSLGMLCLVGFWLAAGGQTLPGKPEIDLQNPKVVSGLLAQLSDSDFAVREQAQVTLKKILPSQNNQLVVIAEKSTDPEVKARLAQRIGELEEWIALSPPPISLDVKDCSFEDLAAALGRSLGKPVSFYQAGDDPRFTLNAKDQPFWDVMLKLAGQPPMWFLQSGKTFDIIPRAVTHTMIHQGVSIAAEDALLWRNVQMAGPDGKRDIPGKIFLVKLHLAADPRIKVIRLDMPVVKGIRDEGGHDVAFPPENFDGRGEIWGANACDEQMLFPLPEPVGHKATISGSASLMLAIGTQDGSTDNVTQHLGEKAAIADGEISLDQILHTEAAKDGQRRMGLVIRFVPKDAAKPPPVVPGLVGEALSRVVDPSSFVLGDDGSSVDQTEIKPTESIRIAIVNERSETVGQYNLPSTHSVTSICYIKEGDFKEPLTFFFRASTKTRTVTIPFEFKDIVLPH